MIAKITRGKSVGGLLGYLLGPTRDEQNPHHDQRVIATSEGLDASRTAAHAAGMSQERFLALQMDAARLDAGVEIDQGHVWHLSLTNRADDRELTDDEWADIARTAMRHMGFDGGRQSPCPWVAVRHGDSAAGNGHVHLAVSLVREDGSVASVWRDYKKASALCGELERAYNLDVVDGRTAGAAIGVKRAELEQTDKHQLPEIPRLRLERIVRATAGASSNEGEFAASLRAQGIVVRPRYAAGDTSIVTGYSVMEPRPPGAPAGYAAPWFGGGRLSKDLALPALRASWEPVEDHAAAWARSKPAKRASTGAQRETAAKRLRMATTALAEADPMDRAAWAPAARQSAAALNLLAHRAARADPQLAQGLRSTAELLARTARAAPRPVKRGPLDNLVSITASVVAASRPGPGSWLVLVAEWMRMANTIQGLHQARGDLQRAEDLRDALMGSATRLAAIEERTPSTATQLDPQHGTPSPHQPERGFER